jgi:hypothetical protein
MERCKRRLQKKQEGGNCLLITGQINSANRVYTQHYRLLFFVGDEVGGFD